MDINMNMNKNPSFSAGVDWEVMAAKLAQSSKNKHPPSTATAGAMLGANTANADAFTTIKRRRILDSTRDITPSEPQTYSTGKTMYTWKILEKPQQSSLSITSLPFYKTPEVHLTPDVPGLYSLQLQTRGYGSVFHEQVHVLVIPATDNSTERFMRLQEAQAIPSIRKKLQEVYGSSQIDLNSPQYQNTFVIQKSFPPAANK